MQAHPPRASAPDSSTANTSPALVRWQGIDAIHLQSLDGAQAWVSLHGAQVLAWQPAGQVHQLYLSPLARAIEGQAIRGGIPVIFPQFEALGPDHSLPRHGLVRTRTWSLRDGPSTAASHASLTLGLSDDAHSRSLWPHGFDLELTVAIEGDRLDTELHVLNVGQTSWSFTAALHTYVAVDELSRVRLEGLQGKDCWDRLQDRQHIQTASELRVDGAMDAVYHEVEGLRLREGPRRLDFSHPGMPDCVVWNPGPKGAAKLADLPDADWSRMVCVEAAVIANPVHLQPQESWTGRQTLRLQADVAHSGEPAERG